MAIETGLRSLLLSQSGIVALAPAQSIAGTMFDAVFNENPVQGFKLPYIVISLIDQDDYPCMDGTTGTASYEIDVDCYAYRYDKSVEMAKAVDDFLKDYTGPAGTANTIRAVVKLNKRHDVIAEAQGRDVREHIESLSYQIQAN